MECKTEDKSIFKIKYDGSITLATGKSKTETHWKNKTLLWSNLVDKLSNTTRTPETYSEYKKMAKTERDKLKDVGGFVGGSLKNGRRKAENIANRTLITLDLDYVKGDVWSSIELLWDFACVMYSTHTHAPDNQRLRLVIPLSRPVLPDEYQAISRMIANDLGIDQFDDTTYQPHRLMYWPSTSSDGEYIFKIQDEAWLNPDDVLARYAFGWQDVSYWPESSRARAHLNNQLKKQEDPLEKKGVIGAFCRVYTISEAISEFLNDIYIPGADETRYTYAQGSTTGGVVVYEDKFSYSHHGTDPSSGILCNAFDLVRIHKFGHLDDEVRIDTKPNNLPSFKQMVDLATSDNKIKIQLGKDRMDSVKDEFGIVEAEELNDKWLADLEYTREGRIKGTIDNVKIILENDPGLKDKLAYNEFAIRNNVRGELPWNKDSKIRPWDDNDEAGIRHYLEKVYGIARATQVINDATKLIFNQNKFHPVRDYLNGLVWDGVKRMDTLLVDYFGVEDNIYTRAATRIFLCGGVARILYPGCQLDYMITLVGPQGIRKGTFYRIMAKHNEWYTELATIKYKEAIEETMGKWIVEMAEMAPTKKSEVEEMKAFITNKSKTIRLAYARNPTDIDRQYVLVASSNEATFLRDATGDRRYLPIDANMNEAVKSVKDDLKNEVDQLWAEAIEVYKKEGYRALMLSPEEEELAKLEQDNHRIVDDEEGTIIEYLDTLLPNDWYEKDLYERQRYFNDALTPKVKEGEGFIRNRVCVKEVMNELYGVTGKIDLRDSTRINKILQGLKNWEKQKSTIKIKGYGIQRGYYRK